MTNTSGRAPLDRVTLAALAGVSVPMATLSTPLVIYLPEFYSSTIGLELAVVGTVFTIVRLLDIAVDPILGGIMDKTNTRWGRYRPWLAAGAPLMMIAVYMLYNAHVGAGGAYLAIWLLAAYLAWSILSLAQLSISAELSPDYHERSRIYGWVQSAFVLGVLLVMTLPMIIGKNPDDPHAQLRIMGWVGIVLAPVAAIFAVWRLRTSTAPGERSRSSLIEYFKLFRNPLVLRLLSVDLLLGLSAGMTSAVALFFYTRSLDLSRDIVAVTVMIHMLPAFMTAPLWAKLAARIDKHNAILVAIFLYAAGQGLYAFIPSSNVPWALTASFLSGCSYSAFVMLPRAMMADVGDEETLRTGANRTGLFYALLIGTWKIGQAVSVGVAFLLLSVLGFDARAGGDAGETGLLLIYVIVPVILALIATVTVFRYPLNAARHAEIRAALDAGKAPEAG